MFFKIRAHLQLNKINNSKTPIFQTLNALGNNDQVFGADKKQGGGAGGPPRAPDQDANKKVGTFGKSIFCRRTFPDGFLTLAKNEFLKS